MARSRRDIKARHRNLLSRKLGSIYRRQITDKMPPTSEATKIRDELNEVDPNRLLRYGNNRKTFAKDKVIARRVQRKRLNTIEVTDGP
jgi:hypothetical protein